MTTCFSGAHFTDDAKNARFKLHPLLDLLIFVGIFILTQIVETPFAFAAALPLNILFIDNPEIGSLWIMAVQLLLTAVPAATVILYCRLVERRSAFSMGFTAKNCVKYYALGLVIGAAEFAAAVGICVLSGSADYSGAALTNVPVFTVICLGWIIQGAEEEILCRGWFMGMLSQRLPLWAAVLINSAFFSLLHILNPGFNLIVFVNLTLFGVFMSVTALRFNSLIPCCAIHSIWNLVQGNIFGLPVSGIDVLPSVWRFTLAENRELWTGGVFGIEGSICETIVIGIFTLIMLFVPQRKKREESV